MPVPKTYWISKCFPFYHRSIKNSAQINDIPKLLGIHGWLWSSGVDV